MPESRHGVVKIVSGGQTGVDRGALDAAIALGIDHGGWCPKGRTAEDGPIDSRYQLRELQSRDYADRTERNVIDSDGTLILYHTRLQGGTLLTNRLAMRHARPLLRVRLDRAICYDRIVTWILDNRVAVLNVAGPRGSSCAGLQKQACAVVKHIFSATGELPYQPTDW